ncbi:MAG: hypothetical protein HW421_1149 [Ignavibacteria bacterium]|nr:hypothetical protein [Ignavibacteria bacterium]
MLKQDLEIELTPNDVAKELKICYSKAKRLMETNEIRSWVDTNASDGRKYLKTVYREVLTYHQRKIEHRDDELKTSKQNKKITPRKNGHGVLSNKSIEEFFRTEIFAS